MHPIHLVALQVDTPIACINISTYRHRLATRTTLTFWIVTRDRSLLVSTEPSPVSTCDRLLRHADFDGAALCCCDSKKAPVSRNPR